MTLVKANWTDTITVAVNGADVDVIVVTLGKANRTDVVANNVVVDVITADVTLGKAN